MGGGKLSSKSDKKRRRAWMLDPIEGVYTHWRDFYEVTAW